MAGASDNAANKKENKESSSEEISSSDSERTFSESSKESSKPYVTPGKAELSAAEQAEVSKAKIAQAMREIAEEEALAKKNADKAMRRAEKAKRKAIKMAKKKEEEALEMLADRATKIASKPKSGRKAQGPPPNKMLSTKHSAL